MGANPRVETAESALARVAVVSLDGTEPPDVLARALAVVDANVTVHQAGDELSGASLIAFFGSDDRIASATAAVRASRAALSPVLALLDGESSPWLDPSWRSMADEVTDVRTAAGTIAGALERLARVAAAVATLPTEEDDAGAATRRIRALRFVLTRRNDGWLEPVRAALAPGLARYAGLDGICGAHLAEDLGALVTAGLLKSEHVDRLYRCACGDGRLHFRDACEHCKSTALEIAHVMRHKCGHAGPSALFWRGEELACPACGELLITAGADYEGPSDETRCTACGKLAKEGSTLATCFACGTTTPAAKLAAVPILRYAITDAGKSAALADATGAVDGGAAKKLANAWRDASRAKNWSLVSWAGAHLSGNALDEFLGEALRPADVAVRVGSNGFLALLAETSRDGAERFSDRVAAAERAAGKDAPSLAPAAEILVHPGHTSDIDAAIAALVARSKGE